MDSSARPFRVLGLQQVAVGHLERGPLELLWQDLLGLRPISRFESAAENVDEVSLRLGDGDVQLDLMVPLDPDAKPRVHTPALHHLGLWVDDLDQAFTWLKQRGVHFAGGIRQGAHGHRVCFIHPKPAPDAPVSGNGVLIELIEAPR